MTTTTGEHVVIYKDELYRQSKKITTIAIHQIFSKSTCTLSETSIMSPKIAIVYVSYRTNS